MTKKLISNSSPFRFFFFILTCFSPRTCLSAQVTNGLFVFGASLVDNGNNDFVETSSRVDFLPYGIDFPFGPSGRFSNGKNMIDVLGELLKLPHFIPVFEDPLTKGIRILHGVNYACGSSGILDETGSVTGSVISLNQQIRNFAKVTVPDLTSQLRCNSIEALSNYMFVIETGGNDYMMNYFIQINTNQPSLQDFTTYLIDTLSGQIKRLYSMGARKFILISIYPLGCTPFIKKSFSLTEGCVETLNEVALQFNSQLKSLVDVLKPQMPGSNLVFVNSYHIVSDIISDPISNGFTDTGNACCETSLVQCTRGGFTCPNRKDHVFFDGVHTTEAVNVLIASKAYYSNLPTEVYPISIQQLAKL